MKRVFVCMCVPLVTALAVGAAAQPAKPTPPSPLVSPLAAGVAAANGADYPAAEKALAAVQGGDRPRALAMLARVMLEQGRFDEAERDAVAAENGSTEDVRLGTLAVRGEILAAQGKVRGQACGAKFRCMSPGIFALLAHAGFTAWRKQCTEDRFISLPF